MNRGDKYRPVVIVLKVKNGLPTVISIGGQVYILQHKDGYTGKKAKGDDGK